MVWETPFLLSSRHQDVLPTGPLNPRYSGFSCALSRQSETPGRSLRFAWHFFVDASIAYSFL